MAIPITDVSPPVVSLAGGSEITLTGTFPSGDLSVYIGPNGNDTDTLCYSGVIGNGYVCSRYSATTLKAVTPPLSRGEHKVSVYSSTDSGLWAGSFFAVEQSHTTGVFDTRGYFPPWVDTGPRQMREEPRQDAAAGYDPPSKSPTRAALEGIGEAISELCGFRQTRLRSAVSAGATSLPVESAEGFESSGTLWLGNEASFVTYTGVDTTPGAQLFTGVSGVKRDHREETEIMDASRAWSRLDLLRRALLVAYADGSDLDRIGRRHAVDRVAGFSDTTHRGLIRVLAYLERGPVYALEQVMDVLYPSGGYEIYESLIEHPYRVFIRMPGVIGSSASGRTFMQARDRDVMSTLTDFNLTETPTTIQKVVVPLIQDELDMSVLPSAASWTYQAETVGAEATFFTSVGDNLRQVAPGTVHCGRYEKIIYEQGNTINRLDAAWQYDTLNTVNGHPWKMVIRDGDYEYCLMWNDTEAYLGQHDGTQVSAAYTFPGGLTGAWQYPTLERRGDVVYARWNGTPILEEDVSSFAVSGTYEQSFGYFATGLAQDWTVWWGWVRSSVRNDYNWWNRNRTDGQVSTGSPNLNSASAPFVVGQEGKRVRLYATNSENAELWLIDTYNSPTQVVLDGIVRTDGYSSSLTPDRLYSHTPIFTDESGVKSIIVTSGLNAGTYSVAEVISAYEVKLTGASMQTEVSTPWKYDPTGMLNETNIPFEIVDAGTVVGNTITLPDSVPGSPFYAEVHYTTVVSGQVLRDETISNSSGVAYWPFYVTGVNERIQSVLRDVTVAGVIPKFEVIYR